MSDNSAPEIQGDMNELNQRIGAAWTALMDTIDGLDERQLSEVRDANDWAIKDHLASLVPWQRSIMAAIQRRPRYEGLGITEQQWRELDADGINAILFERYRDLSAAEVLEMLRAEHQQTLDTLARFTWEDVMLPYNHYLQDETDPRFNDPILFWIMGNTAGHYDEHREWIEAIRDGK
jgi:hypothetical protein